MFARSSLRLEIITRLTEQNRAAKSHPGSAYLVKIFPQEGLLLVFGLLGTIALFLVLVMIACDL
jgi:hypothetical protein